MTELKRRQEPIATGFRCLTHGRLPDGEAIHGRREPRITTTTMCNA
jgi:hypothetical protein